MVYFSCGVLLLSTMARIEPLQRDSGEKCNGEIARNALLWLRVNVVERVYKAMYLISGEMRERSRAWYR